MRLCCIDCLSCVLVQPTKMVAVYSSCIHSVKFPEKQKSALSTLSSQQSNPLSFHLPLPDSTCKVFSSHLPFLVSTQKAFSSYLPLLPPVSLFPPEGFHLAKLLCSLITWNILHILTETWTFLTAQKQAACGKLTRCPISARLRKFTFKTSPFLCFEEGRRDVLFCGYAPQTSHILKTWHFEKIWNKIPTLGFVKY